MIILSAREGDAGFPEVSGFKSVGTAIAPSSLGARNLSGDGVRDPCAAS
jgi:hypothetical protein